MKIEIKMDLDVLSVRTLNTIARDINEHIKTIDHVINYTCLMHEINDLIDYRNQLITVVNAIQDHIEKR